jgi:hypothetical protein
VSVRSSAMGGHCQPPVPGQDRGLPIEPHEAPQSPERVGAGPTRRAVLTVGSGLGLAAFLTACGGGPVPKPTAATARKIPASPAGVAGLPLVRITTTGATFSPSVELAAGSTATVSWHIEGGVTVTGLNPRISFGKAATRRVRMTVEDRGADALHEVSTFNLGFNNLDDGGIYNMGARYDKAAQGVTLVENVSRLTGLRRFAAAHTALAGSLDFTGCSRLQYIECMESDVQSMDLTGCTSLIRLVMERTNLTTLDLNPVAANLRDLRGAVQQSGQLTLTPLKAPMAALYHFCVRDQVVINHPTAALLPVVQELWDWTTDQSGALTSQSSAIRSLLTSYNYYTTADLTDQFPAGRRAELDVSHGTLSSLVLAGCKGLGSIDAHINHLSQAAVDDVLAEVDSWGTGGGTLGLQANAVPSPAGFTHAKALTRRGWTVTTDA